VVLLDEEALQPPCSSPVVPFSATTASVELPQDPRDSIADPPNLEPNQDFPNPIPKQDSSHSTRKWDSPDPIRRNLHN